MHLLKASPRPTCRFVLTVLLLQMLELSSTASVRTAFARTKTVANNHAHSVGVKWHANISPKFKHVLSPAHGQEDKHWTVVPAQAWENIFHPPVQEDLTQISTCWPNLPHPPRCFFHFARFFLLSILSCYRYFCVASSFSLQ